MVPRMIGGAPASVAQYYTDAIRKIEAELAKIQELERRHDRPAGH